MRVLFFKTLTQDASLLDKSVNAYTEFLQELDQQTVVLTPNRRLSATLHKLYSEKQCNKNLQSWLTPSIFPITTWLQLLWKDYTNKAFFSLPLILNSIQEQLLWEKIINETKQSECLLQSSEAAELAKSAWNLLKQWQVSVEHPIFESAEDYFQFQQWALNFEKIVKKKNWLTIHTLTDVIIAKIKQDEISVPKQLLLMGFTELTPQLQKFITTCQTKHCTIKHVNLQKHKSQCRRISLKNFDTEILTMARLAKTLHAKDKNVRIGCVIPTLRTCRDKVQHIFSQVFAKENAFAVDPETLPFNISAGKCLTQYPIIHAALQLLSLQKELISIDLFSFLLSSPFIGEAVLEYNNRGKFDSVLRYYNIQKINITQLLNEASAEKVSLKKYCPHLAKRLLAFFSYCHTKNKLASFSEWIIHFNELLTLLGWPGERSLNSEEYQIVENWLQLLKEFRTLDIFGDPVNYQQALHLLYKIANKTTFQIKTPEAPIQVLGVLEAAGLTFDYLWIAGMDDLAWPPKANPNPFIPKQLQRELNMPHATAARELMYCEELTHQFKQAAKQVIFSHAQKSTDINLQISPLIHDLQECGEEELSLDVYHSKCLKLFQHKQIEIIIDDKGSALHPDEKIIGGVNIIKQQSLCPFKAFAQYRLHARSLLQPTLGLRPIDRGIILHKVMELLWKTLQNQSALLALNKEELDQLIEDCIDKALLICLTIPTTYVNYLALEKKRLHRLILEWFEIEKKRPAFTVIATEQSTDIQLNHLLINVRIDRIDELVDGTKLIIDYKTNKINHISDWFGERPNEPQLPLYILSDLEKISAISFAQLNIHEKCFKGMSRHTVDIEGIKPITEMNNSKASWPEQLEQWNKILLKLSDDFYAGVAKVDPKNAETCTFCDLNTLCRLNEEVHDHE